MKALVGAFNEEKALVGAFSVITNHRMELLRQESHLFDVRMGWHSAVVKKELKNLEWSHSAAGWRKTGVLVEFSDLAFHFSARYTF